MEEELAFGEYNNGELLGFLALTVTLNPTANADGSFTASSITGTEMDGSPGQDVTFSGPSPVGTTMNNDNHVFTTEPVVDTDGLGVVAANIYNSNQIPLDINYSGNDTYEVGSFQLRLFSELLVCFAQATRIRTVRGDVAIEDLALGDLVVTTSGAHRPVMWLGQRTVDYRNRHPNEAMPVRVAANAFGESQPARDLVVSPGHALCVDILGEVLIPAGALVNGATIRQEEVECITYWHVELDGHDVILAENMPAESYADVGNRGFFRTGHGAVDPERTAATLADYCRPFYNEGVLVEVLRSRLRARAVALGWKIDVSPQSDLHLLADGVRIEPDISGAVARFVLTAPVHDVWLVSETSVPRDVSDSTDRRRLGVYLAGLEVDDGLEVRRKVTLDDPLLCLGFQAIEQLDGDATGPRRRWTAGRAKLPGTLFAGCRGIFFLRVELDQSTKLGRWVAPKVARMPQLAKGQANHVSATPGRLNLVEKAS